MEKKMKSNFLLKLSLLTLIVATSCIQPNEQSTKPSQTSGFDTSIVAVIQFDKSEYGPFPKEYEPTNLTTDEIMQLDNIIKEQANTYNQSLKEHLKEAYSVYFTNHKYKRQYIPVINTKGEKEVWANFFCNSWSDDWKTEVVFVKDGGNCYFNIKVNLSTKKTYELNVNGYAWESGAPNSALPQAGLNSISRSAVF
ncbi:hypothetical protein [Cnuella takakiae]|nr:hypothetical protein [Cnuella takakiae]